jgi:dedicator of cytokinesis protein 3
MSSHDETCQAAVEILFSMIYAEYILDGKFDAIETEVFGKLDKLVSNLISQPRWQCGGIKCG